MLVPCRPILAVQQLMCSALIQTHGTNHCFSDDHEICRPTNHFDVIRTLAHQHDPLIPLARIEDATRQRQARFDYALTTHVSQDAVNTLRKLRDQGYQIAPISDASTAEVKA